MKDRHHTQITKIFDILEPHFSTLSNRDRKGILSLMRLFRVFNNSILDFSLYYADSNFDKLSYLELLQIVKTSIAAGNIVPYELLYKLRNEFNLIYHKLDPNVLLGTLLAFSKTRLFFAESFYENLFVTLKQDALITKMKARDCVYMLNAYRRTKYRDADLFERSLSNIRSNFKYLNRHQLKLLLLTLADLSYPDNTFFSELYQQFNILVLLTELNNEQDLSPSTLEYLKALHDYLMLEFPQGLSHELPPDLPGTKEEVDVDKELDLEIDASINQ